MNLQDMLERGRDHHNEFVRSGCVSIDDYYRHWCVVRRLAFLPLTAAFEKKRIRREINLQRLSLGLDLI